MDHQNKDTTQQKTTVTRKILLVVGIIVFVLCASACCLLVVVYSFQYFPIGMAGSGSTPDLEPESTQPPEPTPTASLFFAYSLPTETASASATQPAVTPDATQTLMAAFQEVDRIFQNTIRSFIAYNAPQSMKLDETEVIELLLQPGATADALSTQVVEKGGLVPGGEEPGVMFSEQGGEMAIITAEIEITDVMKAVLISPDPDAFQIQEMHGSPEQPISTLAVTSWRWAVTARQEGTHTLELIIYRLLRVDGESYWREVQTYDAEIVVEVSPFSFLKTWDWKWTLGIIISLLQIPLVWTLLEKRKKNRQARVGRAGEKRGKGK